MIEFTALPMLFSLLAAGIPYLLLRSRLKTKRTILWSSNRLLQDAMKSQARKLNWLQWILLLLRTLAIVGLALAVANPIWKSSNQPTAMSPVASHLHVFLIDTSPSMLLQDNVALGNATRLNQAIEQIREKVSQLPTYDMVAIVACDQATSLEYLGDHRNQSAIVKSLQKVSASTTSVDVRQIPTAIVRVIDESKRRSNTIKQGTVHLYSDFSVHDWSINNIGLITQENRKDTPYQLSMDFQFHRLGQEPKESSDDRSSNPINNLTLRQIDIQDARESNDQCRCICKIANTGNQTINGFSVQLWLEDQFFEEQSIETLASSSECEIEFNVDLLDTRQRAEFRLPPDALVLDNTRYAEIPPRLSSEAVVIADREKDSLGLQAAYQAFGASVRYSKEKVGYSPDTFVDFHFVDPLRIDDESASNWQSLAEKGNSVYVWLGNHFSASGLEQIVAPVIPSQSIQLKQWNEDRLMPLRLITKDADLSSQSMLLMPIEKYWHMGPQSMSWMKSIELENGDTLAVQRNLGLGSITWIGSAPTVSDETAGDLSWNAMVQWPTFVPLLDHLRHIARDTLTLECQAGDKLVIPLPDQQRYTIHAPDGSVQQVVPNITGKEVSLVYAAINAPGHYRITKSYDQESPAGENSFSRSFAVNVDPDEFNFAQIPLPETPQALAVSGDSPSTVSTQGLPIFRVFLWIAILALLLESIVTLIHASVRFRAQRTG